MKKKPSKPQFGRRQKSYMDRPIDSLAIRQHILIVCEGEKTEPQYFMRFHVTSMKVHVVGTGMNTISLVEEAINLQNNGDYDQVWCVFDKDDFPIDQFENAIDKAKENGMRVAYSNQAFELWYVLHFEFLHSSIDRAKYMKKLDQHLGRKYKKNDPKIYDLLVCNRDKAIKNAYKLMEEYYPSRPGCDDPSTTVHELITVLVDQSKPLKKGSS